MLMVMTQKMSLKCILAMKTKRDEGLSFLTKSNFRFNHLNFSPESVGEWPPYGNYKFDK